MGGWRALQHLSSLVELSLPNSLSLSLSVSLLLPFVPSLPFLFHKGLAQNKCNTCGVVMLVIHSDHFETVVAIALVFS